MNEHLIDLCFIKNEKLMTLKELLNVECIDFKRDAPNLNVEYQDFSGSNGSREVNSSFKSFNIEVKLYMEFDTMYNYQLKETELYSFILDNNAYYILTNREPGKRYKVRPSSIKLDEVGLRYAIYSVTFNVFEGHSESLGTSLSDFSLDEEWQFSQGLLSDDYSYIHDTSNFIIYNPGDFTVDPREQYLSITLEGEANGDVTIFNKTTGERFIYYPELSTINGQTLSLDRVIPKLNGVACGINTNHGLITLVPGENHIQIQNVTRVKSSWDFRFLYK